tara:strand:+ start:477 stop:602 length:126 start_codon:yes stop_codon:yes gene_type:complete
MDYNKQRNVVTKVKFKGTYISKGDIVEYNLEQEPSLVICAI